MFVYLVLFTPLENFSCSERIHSIRNKRCLRCVFGFYQEEIIYLGFLLNVNWSIRYDNSPKLQAMIPFNFLLLSRIQAYFDRNSKQSKSTHVMFSLASISSLPIIFLTKSFSLIESKKWIENIKTLNVMSLLEKWIKQELWCESSLFCCMELLI